MKRRAVIKGFIAISANLTLIPACNFSPEVALKEYANLSLNRDQRGFIDDLSKAILPTTGIENYKTLEPTLDFILGMLNDCYPKEDIAQYQAGLIAFQAYLKEKHQATFANISTDKLNDLFATLSTSEAIAPEVNYFFSTTTDLTKKHFISSEYYQKQYMDFEFAPGRYVGCVAI